MSWLKAGEWLKSNGGTGLALVGSILTGNVPSAVAAGVSLIGSVTGESDPEKALEKLQQDPQMMITLKELYYANEASLREHYRLTVQMQLQDAQAEHETTQVTIRNGDNSDDRLVRWTRPLQSWLSLVGTFAYIFYNDAPSLELVIAGFTLPWAYAGLRQIGKGITTISQVSALKNIKPKGN